MKNRTRLSLAFVALATAAFVCPGLGQCSYHNSAGIRDPVADVLVADQKLVDS